MASRSGAVAIMFGLIIFVLLGTVGVALDYLRGTSNREKMQRALDAATLAAAGYAVEAVNAGKSVTTAKAEAIERASQFLMANIKGVNASSAEPSFIVQETNGVWTTKGTLSADLNTVVGSLFGIDKFKINVLSEASNGGGVVYADFYLLLDTSHSMGVGATASAISDLTATVGCAFACHSSDPNRSTYEAARAAGIPLRIDLESAAVNELVDEVEAVAATSDQFRMGIWKFSNTFTRLIAPTDRLDDVKSVTSQITLAQVEDGTQFDDAASKLAAEVTTAGDGTTKDKPKKFAFIVTDGVQDGFYTGWMPPPGLPTSDPSRLSIGGGMESPISTTACDALKAKGITVAVLYTPYLKFTNPDYDLLVGPYEDVIEPNLKSCASEGYFYKTPEALSGSVSDVKIGLKAIFEKALIGGGIKGVHITN